MFGFVSCVIFFMLHTVYVVRIIFFFMQNTAYELRISDWSSDVCSADLADDAEGQAFEDAHAAGHVLRVDVGGEAVMGVVGHLQRLQIGRASCRERVCQYV